MTTPQPTVDLMREVYRRTRHVPYGGIYPRVDFTDDIDQFLISLEAWLGALTSTLQRVADEKRANDVKLNELLHQRDAVRSFLGLDT